MTDTSISIRKLADRSPNYDEELQSPAGKKACSFAEELALFRKEFLTFMKEQLSEIKTELRQENADVKAELKEIRDALKAKDQIIVNLEGHITSLSNDLQETQAKLVRKQDEIDMLIKSVWKIRNSTPEGSP
jgi:predicted  nucleic acid-binding Zn-ribbon protein